MLAHGRPEIRSALLVAVTRWTTSVTWTGRKPSNTTSSSSRPSKCRRSAVIFDRAGLDVLDRGVDAADRALERAGAAVVERAGDLEVDHAGLVVAAEHDHATAELDRAQA